MSEMSKPVFEDPSDVQATKIVGEEQKRLSELLSSLEQAAGPSEERRIVDYESQLLILRDEIGCARNEDLPPLLEQMERLQHIAARHRQTAQAVVDKRSPYFGRMVLEENGKSREVLVGRTTYSDPTTRIRIVDWRDAPISRLYYRYREGDEYDENFGGRDVEGEVVLRRGVSIAQSQLKRVTTPQGTFQLHREKGWRRADGGLKLTGGQGSASRADASQAPGKLGTGAADGEDDKHLREITSLIDARQFDLITQPESGLVIIQGGAGSGKTTIGLHRLAYLAFRDPHRFRPDKMLVIVCSDALVRYISQVLPALDVEGVGVRTFEDWANRARKSQLSGLPTEYSTDTPNQVTWVKKHPLILKAVDAYADDVAAQIFEQITQAMESGELQAAFQMHWLSGEKKAIAHRCHALKAWSDRNSALSGKQKNIIARAANIGIERSRDIIGAWAEICTDRDRLRRAAIEVGIDLNATPNRSGRGGSEELSEYEIDRCVEWTARTVAGITRMAEEREERKEQREEEESAGESEDDEFKRGVDGGAVNESVYLDREDDTIFLRLCQKLRGPLMRAAGNEAMIYEHILIDEAQDLSPVELAVIMGTASAANSVTLSGDVAQRLLMNNGFDGWESTLGHVGLSHTEVEPLKLSYRSSAEIIEFAQHVLGDLAPKDAPEATRHGAPVEVFSFPDPGDAVAFLGEALRELMQDEPRASVAIISRFPEQAELYYNGLARSEIPNLRRVANQDFQFKPGIDVTDVRQVKGLEFDYVILTDVGASSYPNEAEASHLLHIAATRAAHQLWLVCTTAPSPLIPQEMQDMVDA